MGKRMRGFLGAFWKPFEIITYFLVMILIVLGRLLQVPLGITTYLYNWDDGISLKQHIYNSNMFLF